MRISDWSSDVCSSDLGNDASLDDDPFAPDPEELRLHLDRYALLSAALGLQRMVGNSIKGLIVIPVHYEILVPAKTRNVYLQRLHEIPAGLYKYMAFSIIGTPEIGRASCRERVCQYV